ncbi:MAG: hypothetical protein HKN47_02690 [Pirellulaceae bacterium]|nr:hypothetical protein [Pirellulaceae bacterium]
MAWEGLMVSNRPQRENRFTRHKKKIALAITVGAIVFIEFACYLVVLGFGHSEIRESYPYNRILSGYTVYRHTPNFDFGPSIGSGPDDPPVVLDRHGFICDSDVGLSKPENVVRIFLMGGSTAIGAGQTDGYQSAHKYPWGNYSYRASIAGQLKAWLVERFPETKFQVITAASYGRRLHQSHIDYSALISRFSPDVVISCDGNNDLATLESGTPYSDTEAAITDYVDLWNNHYRKSLLARSNTYYVLERISRRLGVEKLHTSTHVSEPSPIAESKSEYMKYRDEFVDNSARFLQTVKHFKATVESDDATFVFCLQPLLHRVGTNKQLSVIETRLERVMYAHTTAPDKAARRRLINRYLFDDYLSAQLQQMLDDDGGFVDVNAHLLDVEQNLEFYTDYCHLTEDGNRITAEILGSHLASQLGPNWSTRREK